MQAQPAVQRGDLRPVDLLLAVQRGDRRLQLVGAGAAQAQRAVELRAALGERAGVPARAVLVGQGDVAAVAGHARVAARVVDEHERQQPGGLGVVGHELREQAAEADRLDAQLGAHQAVAGAGGVALVEDEVDDGEHAGQAIGHLGVAGDPVGDAARPRSCAWRARGAGPSSARAPGRRARSPAVVSPPSVRSVSATRASIASAGWQQVKTRRRRSSARAVSSVGLRRPRRGGRAP